MRKLLNTLYVTTPESYLALDGENVVVKRDDAEVVRLPLHNLESILTFGYTGASPALMGACAKRGIDLCFLTATGRFLARVSGESRGNVLLRKTQFRSADLPQESLRIAKGMIIGKLYNSRSVVDRTMRDHEVKVDMQALGQTKSKLTTALKSVQTAETMEQLRGVEGAAAQVYFGAFDHLIITNKEAFRFDVRSKRPPLNQVNAVLSFLYVLLARDCAAALEAVGLDAYVGFMHTDRPGRTSLALDLMEEFRSVFADRLALTLINRSELAPNGFLIKESGAVEMDDDTRKVILNAWQTKKKTIIMHPFLGEKVEWGLVPHIQAMLLARYLRGDLDGYPPFLWK